MNIDDVSGYFRFLNFRNDRFLDNPEGTPPVMGDGELLLFITDDGKVTGTLAFAVDGKKDSWAMMDLAGTVTAWDEISLRFIGKGRAETETQDWEYQYDCKVAHHWEPTTPPGPVVQRVSLVGTAQRTKDHATDSGPTAKAGVTTSFIAVQRDFPEPRDIEGAKLISQAVTMLASEGHRLRHVVWHTLRRLWHAPAMSDSDRNKLKDLGWYLSDPPSTPTGALDLTNGAGEDFLYMHRRMIAMLHDVYKRAGKRPPAAWETLPDATAPQFAYKLVPDASKHGRKTFVRDPEHSGMMVMPPNETFFAQVQHTPFFRFNKTPRGLTTLLRNVEANLRNPRILAQLTLGAYGNLVEFTLHNWMHMRWATISRNPRTREAEVRYDYDVNLMWADRTYDYLGDFYSSHVNPLFWRLHGWVDDRIESWHRAHEDSHPGQVRRQVVRGIPWFAKGQWVIKDDPFDWPGAGMAGGDMGDGHMDDDPHEVARLKQVVAILKDVAERSVKDKSALRASLPSFAQDLAGTLTGA